MPMELELQEVLEERMAEEKGDGRKNDAAEGKPLLGLLPTRPLEQIARVLEYGAKKYAPHGWRNGIEWQRTLNAALRHLLTYNGGEDKDTESGLSHLAHAACNLLFLLEYEVTHPELDDRYKSGPPPNGALTTSQLRKVRRGGMCSARHVPVLTEVYEEECFTYCGECDHSISARCHLPEVKPTHFFVVSSAQPYCGHCRSPRSASCHR